MILSFNHKRYEGNVFFIKTLPFVNITDVVNIEEDGSNITNRAVRFTLDGVNYTNWQDLSLDELKDTINDSIADNQKDCIIEFRYSSTSIINSISVEWNDFAPIQVQFQNSIFSTYFDPNDVELSQWYFSILDKAFNSTDIISNYLKLDKSNEDSVQFWKSLSKYFAFYVKYARVFGRFYENKGLLEEFLRQRDLIINSNRSVEEAQVLMKDIFAEFFSRGTMRIVAQNENYQGELLRLIQKQDLDEFIFNYKHQDEIGWCIGKSSPLYRAHYKNRNNDKFTNQEIVVDNRLDYLLYLEAEGVGEIEVVIEDVQGNQTFTYTNEVGDGVYPLKYFVFNKDQINVDDKMSDVCKTIKITITTTCQINYQHFGPKRAVQSHGFIQLNNLLEVWLKNNNNQYNIDDIHAIITHKLIPYSTNLNVVDIDDVQMVSKQNVRQTMWIASDGVCETIEWIGINPVCEVVDTQWIGEEQTSYIN